MTKDTYKILGIMSGTSLDGIDLAYVTLDKHQEVWKYKMHDCKTIGYSDYWYDTLKDLVKFSPSELAHIDKDYTKYLAETVVNFTQENKIDDLDFISSHGHTALHEPEKGITYQIGNLPELANLIKLTVVCDFRVEDVEMGGQGAPLVPIGDLLLFGDYDFCVNLGGFANISTEIKGERIAYDVCPLNIVLNHYTQEVGKPYDDEGKLALTGELNLELLNQLNSIQFYKKGYPKSLGIEWVSANFLPITEAYKLPVKDILRTCIEHFAIQITNQFRNAEDKKALFTGGGVYNTFLMRRIENLSAIKVIKPSSEIIEFKEALVFALLGALKMRNEVNCLSTVTGALRDHSSGKIYRPENSTY
ncbi:anhydro-N-acetylmuramic acid kinase [Flavobacteriaceae bacterium MAR_2010_188]|nr:anhydro-N-acetylmuramic acid kinase [Flavobacteriaceae bacterium MAR_2010_188]